MTQFCCPSCGLRFPRATAAHLVACPECGAPPESVASAEQVLGFRLALDCDDGAALTSAGAIAMAIEHPGERLS
jgi:hypothetical protein